VKKSSGYGRRIFYFARRTHFHSGVVSLDMFGKFTKILLIAFVVAGLMVLGVVATAAHAQQMPMRGGIRLGSSTRGYFSGGHPTDTPSGTLPFVSGTFPGGLRGFPTSTASSTGGSNQPHPGFFGSIANFFGGIFGRFKF